MAEFVDYYEILQVSPLAESEVINAAYKKLAQKYHPDINKRAEAAGRMKKINSAYEVLGNDERRIIYHAQWLKEKSTASNPEPDVHATPPPSKPAPTKNKPLKSLIKYFTQNIRRAVIALIGLSVLIILPFCIVGIPTVVNSYLIVGKWQHGISKDIAPQSKIDSRLLDKLRGLPENKLYYLEFSNNGKVILTEDGVAKSGIYTISWIDNLDIKWGTSNETAKLKFSEDGNKLYLLHVGYTEDVFGRLR